MRYLSLQDILFIHASVIEISGGSHGVRDRGLLASLVEKPQMMYGGKELYAGVYVKAAIYLESIAKYRVFIDGNKRTAFAVSARFLAMQGYVFDDIQEEVVAFMVAVATGEYTVEDIATWIQKHTKKQ